MLAGAMTLASSQTAHPRRAGAQGWPAVGAIMAFSPAFPQPFQVFDRGGAAAAATPWYLSGGAPTPIAVYQPKGAASLAASYVNLVTPGTYDAAPGVAPTLDTSGWVFNGATQYLVTTVVPSSVAWSMLVRWSDGGFVGSQDRPLVGSRNGGGPFELWYSGSGNNRYYLNGATLAIPAGALASGVMGFAGKDAYLNGAPCGTISAGTSVPTAGLWIGATNSLPIDPYSTSGKIQAFVIYSSTLTALQVAAVSAAMAAL